MKAASQILLSVFACALWLVMALSPRPVARADEEPAAAEPTASAAEEKSSDKSDKPGTKEKASTTSDTPRLAKKQAPAGPALPWAAGLTAGRKKSEADGKPLLVRFGAPWCGWCKKLDAELESPKVQEELRRWALAYVDTDDAPDDARQLGVGPIPALRILSAAGNVLVEQDGYLAGDELLDWLKTGFGQTQPGAAEALVGTGPPAAADVARLIAGFADRSVVRRETAMRRLLAQPAVAAAAVAEALQHEKLSVRLAALELLREWHAPVDALDPWRPETMTTERIEAVRQWAAGAANSAPAESKEIAPDQLAEADKQLDRLLAGSDDEAAALSERLARWGARLLPLVAERLKGASDDRGHERLLTLRYRLVAADALVLNWPAGLKRLAAVDVKLRRQAAEELVARATEADQPLLLELFSDGDPLVREISLRGLQRIGGSGANGALVKLLDDPDPNVRAAVLKQLAEDPGANFAARVADYAKREPDADLVVHAVRYLKASHAPLTTDTLIELMKHASWQVRAEAAEALGEIASNRSGQSANSADIYAALIELLADEDGFVVSRAMKGLQQASLAAAVKPLAKAAEAHPELAADIVQALVGGQLRSHADAELRKFTTHQDARVRASAIAGLIGASRDEGELVLAGLGDDDTLVRKTTAESVFAVCELIFNEQHQNTRHRRISKPPSRGFGAVLRSIFSGEKVAPAAADQAEGDKDPTDEWLKEFRGGKHRPKWVSTSVEPLEKMLAAAAPPERQAAALALAAVQGEEKALPVLREIARTEAAQRGALAPALPFLLWAQRQALFEEIVAFGVTEQQLAPLTQSMAAGGDPRAARLFWKLLERTDVSTAVAQPVFQALSGLISGDNGSGDGAADLSADPELSHDTLTRYAREGTPWQRDIALALLINDAKAVVELATPILDDPNTGEDFRTDALQLLLASLPEAKGEKLAIGRMASKNQRIVKAAVSYLVHGSQSVSVLRDAIYLNSTRVSMSYSRAGGEKIEVEAPDGLTEEQVRPLLASDDPATAAGAGYLLATLGNADGIDALVKHWRDSQHGGAQWARPVYRAIAALDDDARTPVLREINQKLQNYEKGEFYWTIRTMHGAEVIKLRKEIRDEVGMDNLR